MCRIILVRTMLFQKPEEEIADAKNHILKVTTEELRERAATMTPTRYWKS